MIELMGIGEVLKHAQSIFSDSSSPRLDAEVLLAHVLKQTRSFLHAHPDALLNEQQASEWQRLCKRRAQGEPVAYLVGECEFWSLSLYVDDNVLIPRPETERLVELVLSQADEKQQQRILDLGTGSGAIALAMASEKPDWSIVAIDASQAALLVAKKNAKRLKLSNVQFVHSHWFDALSLQAFDIIVSNPPYIAKDDPHLTQGDLIFEPKQALVSGGIGMDAIISIIASARRYLACDGQIYLEHGYTQATDVYEALAKAGFVSIESFQDYAGLDRVTMAVYKG